MGKNVYYEFSPRFNVIVFLLEPITLPYKGNIIFKMLGLPLGEFGAIGRSLDKTRKLEVCIKIRIAHVFLNFNLTIYAEFHNR